MKAERFEYEGERQPFQYIISDLKSDMGEPYLVTLFIQEDGDAILNITDPSDKQNPTGYTVEFCTKLGGGRHSIISRKLRELAELLYLEQNDKEEFDRRKHKELMQGLED